MKSNIEFLYEELRKATDGGSESMTHDDALKQIEYWQGAYERETALQARVKELEGTPVPLTEWQKLQAERDTLAAKLAALEKQEPVAWIKYLIGAECKADGRCYDMIFCPMEGYKPLYLAAGAQPDTTALEYMRGYSDGKAWALEEAERVCKQMECAIDGGGNTYYRPADARQCTEAIRKIGGSV